MHTRPIVPEQQSELAAWITKALELMPYMASVLLSLRPLDAPGLGTFACDKGYRLYVDFDAVTPLGLDFCSQALLHECCHLFAHDAERAEEYGVRSNGARQQWNLASDAANNDDLVAAGCTSIAENGFLPSTMGAPEHLTAEQYMALLASLPDDNQSGDDDEQGDEPGSSGAAGSGQGSRSGGGTDSGTDAGSGTGEPYAGCGSGSGGEAAPCELGENDDAGGAAPAATSAEKRVIDISTAADIRAAASKGIGTVPAGLVERANQVLTPSKLPWRQILSSSIRRSIASRAGDTDVTYARRNRRRPHISLASGGRIVRPGSYSPVPTLAVVRDTSGSMGKDELEAASIEVEGIAKQLGIRGENLILLDVDVVVAAKKRYLNPSQLQEVAGRGGTDMCVGIAAATELRPRPNAIVVITDGLTPWPNERGRTPPTVAVIVGRGAEYVTGHMPSWIKPVIVDAAEAAPSSGVPAKMAPHSRLVA